MDQTNGDVIAASVFEKFFYPGKTCWQIVPEGIDYEDEASENLAEYPNRLKGPGNSMDCREEETSMQYVPGLNISSAYLETADLSQSFPWVQKEKIAEKDKEIRRLKAEHQCTVFEMTRKQGEIEELKKRVAEETELRKETEVKYSKLESKLAVQQGENSTKIDELRKEIAELKEKNTLLRSQNGSLQDLLIYQHERNQTLREEIVEREKENSKLQLDVENSMSMVRQALEENAKLQNDLTLLLPTTFEPELDPCVGLSEDGYVVPKLENYNFELSTSTSWNATTSSTPFPLHPEVTQSSNQFGAKIAPTLLMIS